MAQNKPVIWRKRYLIPSWTVRIIIMLFFIGVYIYAIKELADDGVNKRAIGGVVFFMLLMLIVLLLDIMSIILFLRDALKPNTFLYINSFQTGFWVGVLIIQIVYVARGQISGVGVAFSAAVLITFLAGLFYAIINYRRAKRSQNLAGGYEPNRPFQSSTEYVSAQHSQGYPQGAPSLAPPPPNTTHSYGPAPVAPHTASYGPPPGHIELSSPPQGHGASADYYSEQPVKPAHMV